MRDMLEVHSKTATKPDLYRASYGEHDISGHRYVRIGHIIWCECVNATANAAVIRYWIDLARGNLAHGSQSQQHWFFRLSAPQIPKNFQNGVRFIARLFRSPLAFQSFWHRTGFDMWTTLRLPQVIAITGLKKTNIYNKINPKSKYHDPDFPRPFQLSNTAKGAVGWRSDQVHTWLNNRAQRSL